MATQIPPSLLKDLALPIITQWKKYTPTFSAFGTVSVHSVWSRRVGDSLELRGSFTAGTVAGSEAQMTLGYDGTNGGVVSDNTGKIATTEICGCLAIQASQNANTFSVIGANQGYMNFGIGAVKSNASAVFSTGNVITFTATIPIQGWTA